MNIQILIIEDDVLLAQNLKENLEELGYGITGIAKNDIEAFYLFETYTPDICIVDINLKGSKKNGIEIIKTLHAGNKIPVIYLTSYDDSEYRELAKPTMPSAYLIKPSSKKQIDVAIDFALSNFYKNGKEESEQINECPFFAGKGYFFVKSNDRYEKIYSKDISFVEASGAYCNIITKYKTHTISANLKSFLSQLNSKKIVRCHRSYAVNIDHIQAFDDISLFTLKGEEVHDIPLSNTFKKEFFNNLPKIKSD